MSIYSDFINNINVLRSKTLKNDQAFQSLGDEFVIELVNSFVETLIFANNEEKTLFIKSYVIIYKTADNKDKKNVFFDYLISLLKICDMESSSDRQTSFKKHIEDINYYSDKMLKEQLLPYKKSSVDDSQIKRLKINTDELFMQHNGDINCVFYTRLDFIIKYLFIENHFGKNDDGDILYEKYQKARLNKIGAITDVSVSIKAFQDLIESFSTNGYKDDSPIICNKNLTLLDGSHRLALCLYYNIPQVSVNVLEDKDKIIVIDEEELKEYGFTENELQRIADKTTELINNHLHPISCILWPPVAPIFDLIEKDISTNCCAVLSSTDYSYSNETFNRITRAIYAIDDIADWKIDKKLQAMKVYEPKIRVLDLVMYSPVFRLKDLNSHTLSIPGEQLKKYIRGKYSPFIPNYIYDIIVHTADNFEQSDYMFYLFTPCIDLSDYLSKITKFIYVLVKHETPYMTKDFPKSYPFGKDIDIICDINEYESLIDFTTDYLEKREHPCALRILTSNNHTLFRLELNDVLLFQIDIGYSIDGISSEFWKKVFDKRELTDEYYVPTIADECIIRANEYIHSPNKKHHLEYISKNRELFNLDDLSQNITYDLPNEFTSIFELKND